MWKVVVKHQRFVISLIKREHRTEILHRMAGKVRVRCVEGEERLQVTFKYGLEGKKERVYNFDRLKSEAVQKTFARIQTNIFKCTNKKQKKKKNGGDAAEETPEEIRVALACNGEQVSEDVPNSPAWVTSTTLYIRDTQYDIQVNLPLIREIVIPAILMAGFPIYPNVDCEFTDLRQCRFSWYKEVAQDKMHEVGPEKTHQAELVHIKGGEEVEEEQPCTKAEGGMGGAAEEASASDLSPSTKKAKKEYSDASMQPDTQWVRVHDGVCYMPTNDDINCRLKVVCQPRDGEMREGDEKELISKAPVTAGPGYCPFEARHVYTQTRAPQGSFRVVTYNILADTYADSDYSRDHLYPYCPPYALSIAYRKQLLIKEIIGYNCDVVCLQEVDKKVFMGALLPALEQEGYEGLLKLKAGQVLEGSATFFRLDKFRLIDQHNLNISESLKEDPGNKDLLEKVCSKEAFKEKMLERSSTLQLTMLESLEDPSKLLAVATTHLYFHPRCPHVRILQTAICLRHIKHTLQQYRNKDVCPALLFCGDLNSYPEGGVHHFLREKHIHGNHADWYAGGKGELLEDMELSHDFDLYSAAGCPRYTNYVTGFSGCLDYIYADKRYLRTSQVVPMPTHEEVTQYTALPNVVFPSDHMAVVCDLEWVATSSENPKNV